jgi:inner membrane protein
MQNQISALRHSSLVKVAGIGILILIMLIPVSMTRGVIHDRSSHGEQARQDIMQSWGRRQTVGGPILVVPYRLVRVPPSGDRTVENGEVYLLPQLLSADVDLVSEIRRRGVHEVPVYIANMILSGRFGMPATNGLGIDDAKFDWDRAVIALPLTDARSVRNAPAISIAGESSVFAAGGAHVQGFPGQIIAPAGMLADEDLRLEDIPFTIELDIGGTERLRFLPLGDTTRVAMRGDWPSPSFGGAYLPETRGIGEDGFTSEWRVSSLGRALPSRWTSTGFRYSELMDSTFGVDLFVPVGLYQQTDRATKYAILFIGLTFVAFFLFEVLQALRLHPLQYLLVGLANTLFYLLLLSLAEHVGFGWAYLISTLASVGLVGGYSATILGGRARSVAVSGMLVLLYVFLYLTLNAETYAMLAGSIALWAGLAMVMYLTRDIDWYALGGRRSPDQTEMFAGN